MTYLVAGASTARFAATYAPGGGADKLNLVGNPTDTAAVATGTAQNLYIYVSSWGLQTNIKCCIYDETAAGALLETVIVNSAVGVGVITVPLAGTTTITSGNNYRLGFYVEDGDAITMFSDTAALTLRQFTSGDYTTPADPSNPSGGFDSNNEFYFAIDDVVGDTVTPGASSYTFGDTITYTSSLSGLNTATLTGSNGNVFTLTGVTDTQASIPALSPALDACLVGAVTLTVGDGVDTATAGVALDPPVGYTQTTLASTAGTPSYVDEWVTAAEIGDQVFKDEPRLTLNADSSYAVTGTTAFSDVVWVISESGGEVTQVTYNFLAAQLGTIDDSGAAGDSIGTTVVFQLNLAETAQAVDGVSALQSSGFDGVITATITVSPV